MRADGWMYRLTDMMQLTVSFHNFANEPKNTYFTELHILYYPIFNTNESKIKTQQAPSITPPSPHIMLSSITYQGQT